MSHGYEINDLVKEESWRLFRIIGEIVEGFDNLSGVEPTVTIFGSAQLKPEDPLYDQTRDIARRLGGLGFTIITGGGPGVMEAANRGAAEAGVNSIGLNINLAEGQACNTYATKTITFNHFFIRKLMLVKYATAFIIMPGGLGTLDELTEVVTLIQTQKIKPFPVVMFNSAYWKGFIDWLADTVLARRFISESDLKLVRVCDRPEEVVDVVQSWYIRQELIGRQAFK